MYAAGGLSASKLSMQATTMFPLSLVSHLACASSLLLLCEKAPVYDLDALSTQTHLEERHGH